LINDGRKELVGSWLFVPDRESILFLALYGSVWLCMALALYARLWGQTQALMRLSDIVTRLDAALRYRKTIWGCRFAVRQQQILLVLNEFWGEKIAFAYCQHKQPVMIACCPASGQFCVFSKNILS
jgi:hypothetical protein